MGLDRTPAADLVQITAATWIEATTANTHWERERDTPRIRQAFATLARTREQWPAPRHFMDAVPRIELKAIARQYRPASPEVVAQARAEMEAWLREMETKPEPKPEPPKREGPPLTEVEAELARHYTDRKSAAAGDGNG